MHFEKRIFTIVNFNRKWNRIFDRTNKRWTIFEWNWNFERFEKKNLIKNINFKILFFVVNCRKIMFSSIWFQIKKNSMTFQLIFETTAAKAQKKKTITFSNSKFENELISLLKNRVFSVSTKKKTLIIFRSF